MKKKHVKQLRAIAETMPPMFDTSNGRNVPVNHTRRLKEMYGSFGVNGIKAYCTGVKKIADQKQNNENKSNKR
jgi:hypothetical protein